jgi:hypothetical protein
VDRTLEWKAEVIALESMAPTQLLTALPRRLPEFFSDVKNFISNIFGGNDAVPAVAVIDGGKLSAAIMKMNYVNMSQIGVFVPPGMNATWEKYLAAMEQSQAVADSLMEETLQPTLRWLAMLLTQPSALSSTRGTHNEAGIVFHDLKKIKENMARCYRNGGTETVVEYGDVFKRNAEWVSSVDRINDLNERMGRINRKALVEAVNEITGAMDKLLIRMKQDPETYNVSGVTMQAIAKISMNLGYEIEFFAAHAAMLQSATQAMVDTKEKIEKILKG